MLRTTTALLLACTIHTSAETHKLLSTPKTVVWGYYDATSPPVLRVRSGDTVEIRSSMIASPAALEAAGVPSDQVESSLRDIYREVKERGAGPHILTGPVYVEANPAMCWKSIFRRSAWLCRTR